MLLPWLPPYADGVDPLVVLLVALAIDAAVGDPRWLPHPVSGLGRLIALLDKGWNRPGRPRAVLGALTTLLVVGLAVAIAVGISLVLRRFDWGWLVEAALAATLIAFRGLHDHVRRVAAGLDDGLEAGRAAVGHIVGRDPGSLDEAGIARAAIESAAENFSDGTVAPVFWFLLLGLPGLAGYKAINTLDSMIGHRTERHADFGKSAAWLDDAVNWLPARLAGLLIVLAAFVLTGTHGRAALRAMVRDAPKHRSPNAGWPEAAMAGALGLALAGPRVYGSQEIADVWMGDGRPDAGAGDIRRALRLYLGAGVLLALALGAAALL